MGRLRRIKRAFCIWIINSFLCGTHLFTCKRRLLMRAGIPCGENTCVVGPLYMGNISNVSFGNNVWVGRGFKVYGNGNVKIGCTIDIAPDVAFVTGSHEIGDHTHRAGKGISYSIQVENGCWIGARATIMGNTTIKEGSIIAAGAVVNQTVGPNAIYGGCQRRRFGGWTEKNEEQKSSHHFCVHYPLNEFK